MLGLRLYEVSRRISISSSLSLSSLEALPSWPAELELVGGTRDGNVVTRGESVRLPYDSLSCCLLDILGDLRLSRDDLDSDAKGCGGYLEEL